MGVTLTSPLSFCPHVIKRTTVASYSRGGDYTSGDMNLRILEPPENSAYHSPEISAFPCDSHSDLMLLSFFLFQHPELGLK